MGAGRRRMGMGDEDKRVTAYNEAGHALIAVLTPEHSDPVHKVTIIPRGMALGLTQTLPEEDRLNYTEQQIYAVIRYAMGGRAAEDLVFGHLSTGAANDLEQATRRARRMVTEYGMSSSLGPVSYADSSGDVFLGRDFMTHKDYSEKKAEQIDDEVSSILCQKYAEAREMLEEHRELLDRVAEALLERETLETQDLDLLLRGEALPALPIPESEPRTETPAAEDSSADPTPTGEVPDPEPFPG